MKYIFFLFTVFFALVSQVSAQAYVKFSESPPMVLKSARRYNNFKIKYHATKASTIYLELKKGDRFIGNGVYDIAKASSSGIVVNVTVSKKIEELPVGDDYSYNLYMYEGGRNNWSKKACKTIVIDGVKVVKKKRTNQSSLTHSLIK